MIIADDEFVKINGVLLDGVFKSIEVTGGALVEEVEVEGKGKKPKQATGYEDCKVTIDLSLYDDDKKSKLEKLTNIQNLFRKSGQVKPLVYPIVNEHITKRGINKVIFKDLSSREAGKGDVIQVSLSFLEYEEVKITTTKSGGTGKGYSSSSNNNSSNSKKATVSQNGSGTTLEESYIDYLKYDRGKSGKTIKTPAYEMPPKINPRSGHQNLVD